VPTMPPYVGDYGDALLFLGENLSWAQPDWHQYRADPGYDGEASGKFFNGTSGTEGTMILKALEDEIHGCSKSLH
jgi:hypothetical protein